MISLEKIKDVIQTIETLEKDTTTKDLAGLQSIIYDEILPILKKTFFSFEILTQIMQGQQQHLEYLISLDNPNEYYLSKLVQTVSKIEKAISFLSELKTEEADELKKDLQNVIIPIQEIVVEDEVEEIEEEAKDE